MNSNKQDTMTRNDALELAEQMITAAKTWDGTTVEYQTGYFDGVIVGWSHAGLIDLNEQRYFRRRLRDSLANAEVLRKKPWWDLVSRIKL